MTARRLVCAHCPSPATCEVSWCVAPTATDDAKSLEAHLCDDCANDLRRNAEPRNFRSGINDVKVKAL